MTHEARMSKTGTKRRLDTFIQKSPVITDDPPHLRATISAKETLENEELKNVVIGIIPLHWVRRNGGKLSDLYNFFKDHDLQKSILQEAVFDALW